LYGQPVWGALERHWLPTCRKREGAGPVAHTKPKWSRLIWLTLHKGVRYEGRDREVSQRAKQSRTASMIRELRILGYRIEPPNVVLGAAMP
jgi:hypothetical protein